MDARGARVNVARFTGNAALAAALVVLLLGTLYRDSATLRPYAVAGLLVIIGVGLRLEAAVMDRR